MILAANNMYGEKGPRYAFCRYGNVVGSNGSVIPLFQKQYAANRPFTITDAKMTRFWISLEYASRFVLAAVASMNNDRRVYIPTMMATNVLDVAYAIGGKRYPINFIGIRPGEKIHETIALEGEGGFTEEYRSDMAPLMSVRQIRRELKKLWS